MGSSHGFESGLQRETGGRDRRHGGFVLRPEDRYQALRLWRTAAAAAGLDSGPPAERWAFIPFDDAVDRVKFVRPRMGSGGDRPQRLARPSLRPAVAVLQPPLVVLLDQHAPIMRFRLMSATPPWPIATMTNSHYCAALHCGPIRALDGATLM